jgi:asparagine synthase (glutamine-hydrolysing)
MCGIAGVIGPDRGRVEAAVRRASAAVRHRGPDDDGVEVIPFGDLWLGLAHRRLSVLDPSPLGRQPMTDPPTGCRVTFNGEIFNFPALKKELERDGERFRGTGDTEVLLAGVARHGPGFTARLEGMYAFAAHDPRAASLTLARDPLGIKPLYTARTADGFAFASEARAVLATGLVPATTSRAAVAGFLAYGSVQQPLTLFEHVRMLPAGSRQVIRPRAGGLDCSEPQVWWHPPRPNHRPADGTDLVRTTRQLLEAAVTDHLISDVPVGLFLSAGIDSSAVAGLAARQPGVRAFTVGFAGQPDLDELTLGSETARRLSLPHTRIVVSCDEAEEAFADWLAAADQPSMDGLNTFVISRAVRREGIKVALSGLGADELFGGYTSFRDVPRLHAAARAVRWLPPGVRGGLAAAASALRPCTVRDKAADMFRGPGGAASLTLQRRRVLSDRLLHALGLHAPALGLDADWLPPDGTPPTDPDAGWTISATESHCYQGNMLLRDADANGMAHGLEIRVPFLDQRLVGFVNRLPGAVRFPRGKPAKWLLREAAADLLHPDLLTRPKTGFTLPLQRWMLGPLRSICEAGFDALRTSGLVAPAGVDAVWHTFLTESRTQPWAWTRPLTLAVLGDYLRRAKPAGVTPPPRVVQGV